MLTAVGVHDFGGGFALATVRSGFKLIGKKSREVGFGVFSCLANRHLLGDDWESESSKPELWESIPTDFIFSNPPCSGFSTLSNASFRGINSPINEMMWELVRYAAKVKPKIVIFESVQQTYTQGIELMRSLHRHLCDNTGLTYTLHHVLHNNLSLGGCSNRRRYFWVASTIPFGVEPYDLQYLPVMNDVLRDLEPLGLTMERQPYVGKHVYHAYECAYKNYENCGSDKHNCIVYIPNSSRWCREHVHDGTGTVDGHDIVRPKNYLRRLGELFDGETWYEGERMSDVMRRYYDRHGDLPNSWQYMTTRDKLDDEGQPILDEDGKRVKEHLTKAQKLIETDFALGHHQVTRWNGDKPPNVLTGAAPYTILHPRANRTLTQREVARIQGFPDDWHIWPIRNAADLGPAWGKGVPVQAGEWIAHWAYESLNRRPGKQQGEIDDHGAHVINLTNDWKRLAPECASP
jgi:site-specific DNA-cytosine methylase